MDSKQLHIAAYSDTPTKDYGFLGVFSSDTVPIKSLTTFPYTVIINTDESGKPGKHWIAMHKDIMQKGWYFDSFGAPPKLPEFLAIMDSCSDWSYNSVQIQSGLSTVCGQYCLFFITHCARGYSMEEIVRALYHEDDTMVNDAIVNEFVKERFDLGALPVVDYPFLISQVAKIPA